MNDMIVWGGLLVAIVIFGWLVWPKDEKPAQLDPVKPEPAPVPVPVKEEPQVVAKTTTKKAPAKKAPAKKAPAKKAAAPKKAVKKGKK